MEEGWLGEMEQGRPEQRPKESKGEITEAKPVERLEALGDEDQRESDLWLGKSCGPTGCLWLLLILILFLIGCFSIFFN